MARGVNWEPGHSLVLRWVLLASGVELVRDLGVNPDTKVIVHAG